MGQTVNYKFPTYEATDSPDLTKQYNTAVTSIDQHIKSNETAAANADRDAAKAQTAADKAQQEVDALEHRVAALEGASGDFNPQEGDMTLTVQQLAAAKVTANGIVYFKGE